MTGKYNFLRQFIAVCMFVPAVLWGQNFEKRAGSEIGAKPCKYDDHPRPCILLNAERLAFVREDIRHKKSERRKVYEKQVKADADFWLRRQIDIPRTGGWFHDFFCSDGAMLEIPKDKVFHDSLPSVCPVCGKTYLNDKILTARQAQVHYWLCNVVRHLAIVYAIEEKPEYAQKAIEILTKYADAYPRQNIMRQTLEEAVVLIGLAESYDLLYGVMSEAQQKHIREDLLWPAAQMLSKSGTNGNWGSWHLSAVGVVGYATRHQRFIDYATEAFKAQIRDQLGDDGLWPESVHTYHFYPLSGFLSFVEAASNNGDKLYQWEVKDGKGIRKMLTAPLRYAYPDTRLPAINDGWYESYLPCDQYIMGYHRYRLPEFAWTVQALRKAAKSGTKGDWLIPNYRTVLYEDAFPEKMEPPAYESIDFPVLGIAILRQGTEEKEMMMTFDYGPRLSHGHPDKMNITLFAKGKTLSPDYGTTGYGSPANRFLRSTASHNTVIIDGKDHPATKDRNLTAFEIHPSFRFASACTKEIGDCEWTRSIIMTDSYAVVRDRIEGKTPHRYDWFFHAEGNTLSINGNQSPTLPAGEFEYPSITGVKKQDIADSPGTAQWQDTDGYCLGMWFMHDEKKQTVFTSDMPTGEGGKTVPLLVLRQESDKAEFVSLIKPMHGKKEKKEKTEVSIRKETDGKIVVTVLSGKGTEQFTLENEKAGYQISINN